MKRASQIYSRIDQDATASNAEAELENYGHYWRISRRSIYGVGSPNMDGMPRSDPKENTAEATVVNHVDASRWVKVCQAVVKDIGMTSERWRIILTKRFLQGMPDVEVMKYCHLEKSQYYEERRDALVAFAEMWPPHPSELVVRLGAENHRKNTGK